MAQAPTTTTGSNKMWTKEGRMFDEKVIYLNKSTTKFVIIGVDPITFDPTMKICDRTTGLNFSITLNRFNDFTRCVAKALGTNYTVRNENYDDDDCGFTFTQLVDGLWKIVSNVPLPLSSMVIQRVSLENYINIEHLIQKELTRRVGGYVEFVQWIGDRTENMNEKDILSFLNQYILECHDDTFRYRIVMDLICNKDYLLTLPSYNAGFFRRKID